MAMKILVSGSLAYDRIMTFPDKFSEHILPDKIHILNVCFMVDGITEQFGGTAGNISYNLALLGEKPLILATAGKDFPTYEEWLKRLGLSLDGIRVISEEFTAGAYITTDRSDNQITGFNPGAMKYSCQYEMDGADPEETLAIISPGNLDDMRIYSAACRERDIPYIFDPGQSIPAQSAEALREMITGSAMLITNDYELELIMQATGLTDGDLLERTPAIVTTLGDRGSRVVTAGKAVDIPIVEAREVLDPTGAGDAYRAGLMKGLAMGKTLVDSARMGAVCASFGVECQGTQCHRFTWEEFAQRYEATFGVPI
jgi:adenosine kinase